MRTIFTFPFLTTEDTEMETGLGRVLEGLDGSRRAVKGAGLSLAEVTEEELRKSIVFYEEAISRTRAALALLRR
jgi:hypothetical protein